MRTGWTVWEMPGVILNLERHAVWHTTDGRLIDVTPKPDDETSILFLPDNVAWDGRKTPSRIIPLRQDVPEVVAYAAASQRVNNDTANAGLPIMSSLAQVRASLALNSWLERTLR